MVVVNRSAWRYIFFGFTLLLSGNVTADSIRIAVASNFRPAMNSLGRLFEESTDHQAVVISGSSGKQYAQIIHGAPFDVFFSADSERPELLESQGKIVSGSRFTYALGQLVLWQPETLSPRPGKSRLENGDFSHLAIANPELAPYGRAAAETLESLGLWASIRVRLVRGENIAQTFQFVASGNAELGFVAWSQLQSLPALDETTYWRVPAEMHQPIRQQAVQLKDNPAARAFMLFIRSDAAITVIRDHGYLVP